MQFSRKFMISSMIVLVIAAVFWQTGSNEETGSMENAVQSDKQDKAFESLNKNVGGKETPITVEAAPVVEGDLIQQVSAQGRVYTYQKATLINEVGGRLVKFKARDGDKVKKGDLIAEIDDHEYRLDYEEAKSNYLNAQAEYVTFDDSLKILDKERDDPEDQMVALKKKLDDGLISKTDYERQKFELELTSLRKGEKRAEVMDAKLLGQSRSALAKAKLRLEKCSIYAPFDGVIFDIKVSQGAYINGSTELALLVNMDDLVVKAKVLESEIGQVFKDRPARINFTALPGLGEIEGSVEAISPIVNEEDKTVDTIVRIKGTHSGIRPGMFAEIKIDSQIFKDRLMVPKTAILPRDNRKVVFRVSEDNRAKWVYVETGVENSQFVEILGKDTLAAGEMVLTDNHFTMGHDTLVKISVKK